MRALSIAGSMTWEIAWALILGFGLSAIVQALVRKATIVRWLGDDRPRTLALASALGAASSSCSYAAVALARSLVRKGADFTAAMAFEIASTNLVVELGIIRGDLRASAPAGLRPGVAGWGADSLASRVCDECRRRSAVPIFADVLQRDVPAPGTCGLS
jgi:uncharacterized membrane protein YraQ (UPF0718 family)